jgi:hypothetical protein
VAWIATRHVFIGTNENLLQFDPLSLVLAVALPLAVARGRAVGTARVLTRLIAALAVVGLAMKLLPWFNQVNGSVIALTLPVHLALAGAVAALAVQRELAPGRSRAASGPAPSRSPA